MGGNGRKVLIEMSEGCRSVPYNKLIKLTLIETIQNKLN